MELMLTPTAMFVCPSILHVIFVALRCEGMPFETERHDKNRSLSFNGPNWMNRSTDSIQKMCRYSAQRHSREQDERHK